MIADNFTFGGQYLSDFGFIMANSEEEDNTGLNREIIKGETTIHKKIATHYGARYTDVITLHFFIVKCDVSDEETQISMEELRRVARWLTQSHKTEKLVVHYSELTDIEYYGLFTDITPFIYNGLNGLKLTFTTTSPFAYETNELYVDTNMGITQGEFYCTSDENDELSPIIKIKPTSSGLFAIRNKDNGSEIQCILSSSVDEYIIDCRLKRILANDRPVRLSDIGWQITTLTDTNNVNTGLMSCQWLKILPGINDLVFTGNGEFEVSCKSPVKIGGITYA